MKLVKLIKLNNLQYNVNRDPAVYRRAVDKEFRLQVMLEGSGTANCRLEAEGETLCSESVTLPGTFECKFSYNTAGSRLGTLSIEGNGEQVEETLRFDVMEHAWIG
jgi:hypothetical protein